MPERPTAVTEGHLAELRALGAQSRFVPGPDGELHVLDYGGEEPVLLVLPGITSPAITWDFVVAELRDLVRPVVMDLRGRGLSAPGEGYRAADFARDAVAVIDALGLDRPLVLGHSLGARVGAALAATGERELGGVTLVDPPLTGPDSGPYPTSWAAFAEQLHEGQAGTTADAVRRFYPKWERPELLLRARWVATCAEGPVRATYDEFTREAFADWWPSVPAPVAFVHGGDSPVVTAEGADAAAAANPAASVHRVDGAGHMVAWDEPDAFLALLRRLLHDHLAARAADR